MAREIKFSLVYRDMWQSSGKYVPRVDQLVQIAPVIIEMGCFDRVETNGGAFEQVNLLFGENPNKAVRAWTAPFNKVGIQTHMLERGLNALRMNPVPRDVRALMYRVKAKQGTNISRSFCGLNDHRNLKDSVILAKEGGMISQVALSITYSPVHTVEYYMDIVDKVVEYGCDEICLKDGFSVASMLEVARAGADYLDVAMEPLSWGKIHPDVITIQAMLKDAGFLVKDINMDAYMEARRLTQTFIDDFLGMFIEPNNYISSSLLVGCGLPGGMMGSMMADLKGFQSAINMSLRNQGKKEVTLNELMVMLFQEVEYVWPKLGYPPLVTPFSQYVKNTALMNLMHTLKGEPRWKTIDKDTMNMILGKTGKLPGKLAPEILDIVKEKGLEFYTGNPQDAFPDELPKFIEEMKKEGWDRGQDDEELFEFAMHERQYRDYKSGVAKERFNKELEAAREKAGAPKVVTRKVVEVPAFDIDKLMAEHPKAMPIQAVAKGKLIWRYNVADDSTAPAIGTKFKEGAPVCYIQTYYGVEPVYAPATGKLIQVEVKHNDNVDINQVLCFIE